MCVRSVSTSELFHGNDFSEDVALLHDWNDNININIKLSRIISKTKKKKNKVESVKDIE